MVLTYEEADEPTERESNRCRYAERFTDRKPQYDSSGESKRPTLCSVCTRTEREVRVMAIDRAAFNQGINAKYNISIDESGVAQTLVAKGPGAVAVFWNGEQVCSTLTSSNAGVGNECQIKKISTV